MDVTVDEYIHLDKKNSHIHTNRKLTICVWLASFCYDDWILMAKLLAFALIHLYSKAKLACYSRYLLTSYFCITVPYDEKGIFFWC